MGTSAPALAEGLGGIEVGQPIETALKALSMQGNLSHLTSPSEAYVAGDYSVTVCGGRVWGVTRQAGTTFASFTRMGAVAAARYGAMTSANVTNQEGDTHLGFVTLKWAVPGTGVTYSLMGADSSVLSINESFSRTVLCRNDR